LHKQIEGFVKIKIKIMKNLEELKSQIPDYVKDVKINLQNLISPENQTLSAKQVFGSALASAYAAKKRL